MLGKSGQAQIGGLIIGVVIAAVVVLIGTKIFSDVNATSVRNMGNITAQNVPVYQIAGSGNLFDLVPLLLTAVVILGIVGYFAFGR